MKNIVFENLKVGDKVFSVRKGWGVVNNRDEMEVYPIGVEYSDEEEQEYTKDGRLYSDDLFPELYLDNPYENQLQERVMEVSDCEDFSESCKRVVLAKKNDKFIAWAYAEKLEDSKKIMDITLWKYAREIKETKTRLTLEDIASKFGVDVKQIEIVK